MHMVWDESLNHFLLHVDIQRLNTVCWKIYSFPHCILGSLVKSSLSENFISGFSILFYWSIYLSLCQDNPVLITIGLYQISKLIHVSSPVLLFFFKTVLTVLGLHVNFHMNFKIGLSVSALPDSHLPSQ